MKLIQNVRIGHSPLTNRIYVYLPDTNGAAKAKKDVTDDVLFAVEKYKAELKDRKKSTKEKSNAVS